MEHPMTPSGNCWGGYCEFVSSSIGTDGFGHLKYDGSLASLVKRKWAIIIWVVLWVDCVMVHLDTFRIWPPLDMVQSGYLVMASSLLCTWSYPLETSAFALLGRMGSIQRWPGDVSLGRMWLGVHVNLYSYIWSVGSFFPLAFSSSEL